MCNRATLAPRAAGADAPPPPQGPKSDTSFRDFSSSFGTSQRSSIVSGGPVDRIEIFQVAPTTYHMPSKFDDIVASSSFSASFRRLNASNKGLHTHYNTNKWMNG